jgi:hypothetical protein
MIRQESDFGCGGTTLIQKAAETARLIQDRAARIRLLRIVASIRSFSVACLVCLSQNVAAVRL